MDINLDLANLDKHIQNSKNGINLLLEHGCFEQARYCTYILIDQLAWVVSGQCSQVNIYVQAWLTRYFKKYYPEISSEEVWSFYQEKFNNNLAIPNENYNNQMNRQLIFIDNTDATIDVQQYFGLDPFNQYFYVNTNRFIQLALTKALADFYRDLKSGNKYNHEAKVKLKELLKKVLDE